MVNKENLFFLLLFSLSFIISFLCLETFSRIIGSIKAPLKNQTNDQIIYGYGYDFGNFYSGNENLVYKDFNFKINPNLRISPKLKSSKKTGRSSQKLIIIKNKFNNKHESLITLIETNHFSGQPRLIALTTSTSVTADRNHQQNYYHHINRKNNNKHILQQVNDYDEDDDEQQNELPYSVIIQYRIVIIPPPLSTQNDQQPNNLTLAKIISGYQGQCSFYSNNNNNNNYSDNHQCIHLLDNQSKVLSISIRIIEQLFDDCRRKKKREKDCQLIKLDQRSLMFDKNNLIVVCFNYN